MAAPHLSSSLGPAPTSPSEPSIPPLTAYFLGHTTDSLAITTYFSRTSLKVSQRDHCRFGRHCQLLLSGFLAGEWAASEVPELRSQTGWQIKVRSPAEKQGLKRQRLPEGI